MMHLSDLHKNDICKVAQGNFLHDTHWHIVDGLNDALQRDDGEIKNT